MAFVTMSRSLLRKNFEHLKNLFDQHSIEWGLVTKMFCGNELLLREILSLGVREAHDSRISNLKIIKSIDPSVQTVYIKPPPKRSIKSVIQYADVSFNTEFATIKMLSDEAIRQNKVHKIIIMIELGDLREGVMGDEIVEFYSHVFELPNITVVGLGSNLNCLHGTLPSLDKLVQLCLYKQIIELKFDIKIPWVSGGTSVTIPLILTHQVPECINHFRVGETVLFGKDLINDRVFPGMHDDVFELNAEIIELHEKPRIPSGELAPNPQGEVVQINTNDYGKTSSRAILDTGVLDVKPEYLIPRDENLCFVGASSDMLVVDLGTNPSKYKVGDLIKFKLKYMGALSIMNSRYINKVLVD